LTDAQHADEHGVGMAGEAEDHGEQGRDRAGVGAQPTEEELRAAYEAELSRISSLELSLQTAVSLLNIGGRRLGLAGGAGEQRDLEQVRDAIDGVRALMPILERRLPAAELRPLRDALAQLQMAYARQAGAQAQPSGAQQPDSFTPNAGPVADTGSGPSPDGPPGGYAGEQPGAGGERRPGPAESSGRLWVPGR
jgi:hypothetical protein